MLGKQIILQTKDCGSTIRLVDKEEIAVIDEENLHDYLIRQIQFSLILVLTSQNVFEMIGRIIYLFMRVYRCKISKWRLETKCIDKLIKSI